jgi:long-chain acyl-CoA synthetase
MDRKSWHEAYEPGVPPSLEYEEITLPAMLRRSAGSHPDAAAVRFMNRTMTYRQLVEDVDRFAAGLASLGVTPGARVAIHLPNLPQTVISVHAALSLGAVPVMTNPLYVSREIEQQWNDAGCVVAVTTDFLFTSRVAPIRSRLPVREYVIASIPEYLRFPLRLLAPWKLRRSDPPLIANVPDQRSVHRFRLLRGAPSGTRSHPPPALDDLAILQYTGGTTGVAKAAMLTHRNLSFQVQQLRAWLPGLVPGGEVFLGALPFFHVFGLTVALNLPVALAAEMVLIPNPRDIPRLISSINRYGVSIFPTVPAMIDGINRSPKVGSLKVGTLKMCVSGSAPMPESTLRRFEERTGGKIVEGYGLTETSPVTHVNPQNGVRKVNTIGLPLPDTDCRIVSLEDGVSELPAGGEGELYIRGPQVMAGYWNRPDETERVLRDGWLRTGDLAARDEEGYFRICGRKKDMILASGYNIYPDEVDQVLSSHPAVLECATIGVPDERRGETVKSFVVLRSDREATSDDLREHCRANLAVFKVPREIEFRDELPKSSVLKVLRRELLVQELRARGLPEPGP